MSLAFANPIHVNGGLIFAAQDYVSAPSAFAGAGVMSLLRWRGRFAGVGIDNNGFMANDVDPNGDPLSYRIVSGVSNGTLATYLGGAFTYTPNLNFVGVDSFVYQLYAGGTVGGTATVNLTVNGAFAGVAISGQLRLRAVPAGLSYAVILQAVQSRVRLRNATPSAALGTNLQAVQSRWVIRSRTATITVGGVANQLVNGDFSGPDISPWIAGPNTLATVVNGQVRLSAVAASQTPVYIYQQILTVPGTPYILDADVIAGLGFGAAGIAIADTLVTSGGTLSYGGHINGVYNATSVQTFVALNFAITDPSEFVLFDNVALVGLTGVASANLQGITSRLRWRAAAAALSVGPQDVVFCKFTLDNLPAKKRRRTVLEEKAVAVLGIAYVDRVGNSVAAPLSVSYRIDCMTTGSVIRAPLALLPAANITLLLTAADNAIIDQRNVRELRRVTVQALYASGEAVNAELDYLVRNLSGVV